MTGKLDWKKANQPKAWTPTHKENRLDRAADNWLEHQSLCKPPKAPVKALEKPTRRVPVR